MTTFFHKYLMDNYIEFKRKHGFTDEECQKYKEQDIWFDIVSDMPEDALGQWDKYVEKNGYVPFSKWTVVDHGGYTPEVEDDGMDELKKELNSIYRNIERTFDEAFKDFYTDEGDSDDDDEEDE